MTGGRHPRDHTRRVLLVVSGLTPQVITETVYALAVSGTDISERFVPTEVQVVTTAEGAAQIRTILLSQHAGMAQLCNDYGLASIQLGEAQLHLVADRDGQALTDIRTAEDNAHMADAITERVREITSDANCALHVSLAGGRKTMGFYAGYALSLFGREQDRLSHVLVSSPFETSKEFLYPTPYSRAVAVHGGTATADASNASVTLAIIPFVRLRQGLPQALLQGRTSFEATVRAANASTGEPSMLLSIQRQTLVADGHTIRLTPTMFALLACLAQRARVGKPPLRAPLKDAHDAAWADEVLADLRAAVGVMQVNSRVETSLRQDCSGAKVSPHFSRLRGLLADHLAPGRAARYFDDGGTHRHKRYCVPLPAQAIRFVTPGDPLPASLQEPLQD